MMNIFFIVNDKNIKIEEKNWKDKGKKLNSFHDGFTSAMVESSLTQVRPL